MISATWAGWWSARNSRSADGLASLDQLAEVGDQQRITKHRGRSSIIDPNGSPGESNQLVDVHQLLPLCRLLDP